MAPRDETSGREDGEQVLSPEELDIVADENVATLGGGRYVVGSSGPPNEEKVEEVRAQLAGEVDRSPAPADASPADAPAHEDAPPELEDQVSAPDPADATETDTGATEAAERPSSPTPNDTPVPPGSLTGKQVKAWLDDQLAATDSRYAYRIAAKSGDTVSHQQLASDDIGMAFDALLLWYVQQVGEGTPVEEALGILLAESNIRVKYPTSRLVAYLEEHELGPDDSIGDLLRMVNDGNGLVFPPPQHTQD